VDHDNGRFLGVVHGRRRHGGGAVRGRPLMHDQVTRKRQQQKARRKRWRQRQREDKSVRQVETSMRLLVCLLEAGMISEAEALADDRSADGPISRALARLHEQWASDFEAKTGRITTG
jgi:hypothetical protein